MIKQGHHMSRYYIKDITINKVVIKNTVPEIVSYLESLCKKVFKQNRSVFMNEMISLGHGYDDPQGAYFTELLADKCETGIIRNDGSLVKTNIHEHSRNVKYRNEMGD